MARIAYVDHSFHRTTRSTAFLPGVLAKHGHQVDHFWDDAWQGGAAVAWDEVAAHDVIIMFQSYCRPPAAHFRQLHRNVVYIPMLDQFDIRRGPKVNLSAFWEPFQGSKVLNFSNAIHGMTTGFGITSYCARYYPPVPPRPAAPQQGLHGFFWIRRDTQLPWKILRSLISGIAFDSFHIHLAADPGTPPPQLPSPEDMARHHITTSTWFDNKADLDAVIERANVYFAPRLEEGIGQSFLEAMGRGQCVVAPDFGTMNEYIISGVNGLLYDAQNPLPLDFTDVLACGAQAHKGALLGRARWDAAEAELVRYILTPSEEFYIGKYNHRAAGPIDPDAVQALRQSGLRALAQRHAALRATRFLWHPVLRFARRMRN